MASGRTTCWAVLGPTGAGKSRFCALLAGHGALLVEADLVAHELLDRPWLRERLTSAFGAGILNATGRVDRRTLGERVFARPDERRRLDALVHPPLAAVLGARLAAARRRRPPLVILEAAVYFLLPGPPAVDLTIAVTTLPEVRLARLLAKGLAEDVARARIAAQAHLEATWQLADRIVANDGEPSALADRAGALWRDHVAPQPREG